MAENKQGSQSKLEAASSFYRLATKKKPLIHQWP
jgi:hypothetical protein